MLKNITTYFISIGCIFAGTYTLIAIILITFKILRKMKLRRQKNLNKVLPHTIRGGTDIEMSSKILNECSKKNGASEIIGSHLKSAIRKMLKNRDSKANRVLDRIIVLLASVVLANVGSQLALTSPDFVAGQFKNSLRIRGATTAAIVLPFMLVFLGTALPLTWQVAIMISGGVLRTGGVITYLKSMHPACDQHVRYLPEIASSSHFIDMVEGSNLGKIFIVTGENIKLFVKKDEKHDDQICTM
jgi:hypothetical protein